MPANRNANLFIQALGLNPSSDQSIQNVNTFELAIAKIPSSYTSGRPTLLFDGESTATSRQYPYLGSYAPAANDRVLVALLDNSGCILGKIV